MSNIKTSKKIILITLGILLVLSLLVGASYAYYIVTHSQTNSNIVKSTCISLSLTNEQNDISLDKQYPISDEAGASLIPYTFTITNTCRNAISYNLNLEMLEGTTLDSKYIKTMLNDNNAVNLAILDITDTSINTSTEARTLASGILASTKSLNYEFRMWMDSNTEADINSMSKEFLAKIVVTGVPIKAYDFEYTGAEQVFTVPQTGTYKIELWGAGTSFNNDISSKTIGYGSYTSGLIKLQSQQKIYIYVGEVGHNSYYSSSDKNNRYNGGGYGNFVCESYYKNYGNDLSGGGATDVRLVNGNWFDFDSLKSRIMVAAGSGGYGVHALPSNGGGLYSENGGYSGLEKYMATGASQVSPGSVNGKFGIGGGATYGGNSCLSNDGGGGGGGYYGGGGSNAGNEEYQASAGAGGSSFISGHNGCNAIKQESTEDNIIHTGQSIHYSGMYFTDTVMIDGSGYKWTTEKGEYTGMTSHDGSGTITGNSGNGYARITYIG